MMSLFGFTDSALFITYIEQSGYAKAQVHTCTAVEQRSDASSPNVFNKRWLD